MAIGNLVTETSEMQLTGTVDSLIFRSEETGYTVARFRTSDRDMIRIVGSFPSIQNGDQFTVAGKWARHPKYGEQFHVSTARRILPKTKEQVIRYLGSGLIKGVGPRSAEKIVEHLGENALEIIKKSPERLREIEGIGEKKARQIAQEIADHEQMETLMVFLKGYGVGNATAIKIWKEYREEAIRVIKENPYRLIDDVYGIGFHTADKIALECGIEKNSSFRIQAGIEHCLKESTSLGHVYLPRCVLVNGERRGIKGAAELLGVTPEEVEWELDLLIIRGRLIEDRECIYLPRQFEYETGISTELHRILKHAKGKSLKSIEKEIAEYERKVGIKLAQKQKDAVRLALDEGVMILTGGPGTGKTTIIRAIISLFEKQGLRVKLAAPTGRAAKRLSEATGREAQTIHRMLEWKVDMDTGWGEFTYNKNKPLPADVLVIDEASMIDTHLMYCLLRAVKNKTRLIIVGDKDQLPSVGPGSVLRDMLDSKVIPTVTLDEIFRQAEESMIVQNAHRINRGEMPIIQENDYENDFWFIEAEQAEDVINAIKNIYNFHFPEFNPMTDIQVLTPMRRYSLGVDALNEMLQEMLNPPSPEKEELRIGARVFREGDKVMVIKNNYDKMVFNGDIGFIVRIDPEERSICVRMHDSDTVVVFDSSELDQITLSYACTIHKSQGSQWPCVITIVSTSHYVMLMRNLVYTAVTRASKQAIVIGTKQAMGTAVRQNIVSRRYTKLTERLRDMVKSEPAPTKAASTVTFSQVALFGS